jgi:HTH-type transcriptional regulator/antitoxin HigA
MTPLFTHLQTHWTPIAPFFSLRIEEEYDAAVERLNSLLDEVGANEQHPLYGLLDTLGTLIHTYEQQHHAIPDASATEVLCFLMDEHGLSAADLRELGTPEEVDAYLAGRQELSLKQLRTLAERFHVSAAAFV